MRSEASLLQGAATQGRGEIGLGALGSALAWLAGLLIDMAAKEEAMEAMVVDGLVRWAAGVYLRAADSELTGRGMLRAVAVGTRATGALETGQGMREAVTRKGMATGAMLSESRIE